MSITNKYNKTPKLINENKDEIYLNLKQQCKNYFSRLIPLVADLTDEKWRPICWEFAISNSTRSTGKWMHNGFFYRDWFYKNGIVISLFFLFFWWLSFINNTLSLNPTKLISTWISETNNELYYLDISLPKKGVQIQHIISSQLFGDNRITTNFKLFPW